LIRILAQDFPFLSRFTFLRDDGRQRRGKMALHTALTSKLKIEHPIFLAPMGSASGGKLAAAVSGAGGLGMIGGAYGDPEVLEREFAAAGNTRVGCGFITWALARRPEALDQAISRAPAAIMLSFGDAGPFLSRIRSVSIIAICQVQSLRQAREVLDQGTDIIVAQAPKRAGTEQTAPVSHSFRPSSTKSPDRDAKFRWSRLAASSMVGASPPL